MKRLIWLSLIAMAGPVMAQSLPYTPTPMGAYLGSGGSWSAWNAVLGSQTLGYTPTAIGLYCSANGTTWQPCNPGSGGGGTTTNPVTFNNLGTGAASGATFNGSSPVTVSYNTLGIGANGVIGQNVFNLLDYGGAGDAVTSTITTALAAGGTVLTDTAATWTPGSWTDRLGHPKMIVINCAGAGSNGCAPFSQALNVSAMSSVSSTTQITFSPGALNTQTLASPNQLVILTGSTTGGLTALNNAIYYYACSVTGTTALLYTSPACTGNVTFTATGTGQMFFGDNQLVTTCAYLSATTCTLATAAGTLAAIGTSYTYGTNNNIAFQSALTAAASGGTVYVPQGKFLATGTPNTPNTIFVAANYAFPPVTNSNVTVRCAGPGATQLIGGQWMGPVAGAYTSSTSLANIFFQDCSGSYAYTPGVRFGSDYGSITFAYDAPPGGTLTNVGFSNMEAYNDISGFAFVNNTSVCKGDRLYSHDGHSGSFSVLAGGAGNTVSRCTYTNSFAANRGDSAFGVDCVVGSLCQDITYIGNTVIGSGNKGVEIVGVTGAKIIGNTFRATRGPCVFVANEVGYTLVKDVLVSDNLEFGCGSGPNLFGNGTTVWGSADEVQSRGTLGVSNVKFVHEHYDADGANQVVGTYAAIVASPNGPIKNIEFDDLTGEGGTNCTFGSGQSDPGSMAGLDIEAGTNISIGRVKLTSPCTDGVYVGPAVLGNVLVSAAPIIDTPNTTATANKYALDIQGGSVDNYIPPIVLNQVTLAGNLNYTAIPANTIVNTFSAAGGYSAASLAGQSGIGTGATAWTVPLGTLTVTLGGTNTVAASSAPALGYINAKRRDLWVQATLGVVPTGASQALILVGFDGTASDVPITVNMYNLQVAMNTTVLGAPPFYTPTIGDVINVGLQGNRLTVSYTRSGTTTRAVDAYVPMISTTSGTNVGFELLSATPTLSAFSVSAP